MKTEHLKTLQEKCGEKSYKKLLALKNSKLLDFVAKYVEHCNPSSVFVRTDSPEDAQYIRNKAIENGEEGKLATPGHTFHFDGFFDQARDKANTKYLLPPGVELGADIKAIDKTQGLSEINGMLKNIMAGKEMYVGFFCLGPTDSPFSIPAIQITDSSYVAHSEDILIREGYEVFKKLGGTNQFFKFVHSVGELEGGVSKNIDKRRVYIDLENGIVFSVNTQYAGNTVGLKKLAMRLAIKKASFEGWLTEHMFIMGVHGPKRRVSYFAGSFPSACGKTSTAMLEGETIIGDDIAYIRNIKGKIRAVNVECGMFGIIQDVNQKGDPLIWKALNSPGEVIFSNVLVTEEGVPYWLGDGRKTPEKGINYSGEWTIGKKDAQGQEITHSHKNARYTVRLSELKNCDPKANDPEGVELSGIIYGGRDSDTTVPVEQAFDWNHGILMKGATIESETTAATLGKEGVRKFNLMANIDFLSIPMGRYINNNCDLGNSVKKPPQIFSVNYFLRDKDGKYLNGVKDKHVWLKWMELRTHGDVSAIKTPTGYMPEYKDLKKLFKEVLGREYTKEDYIKQFTLRIPENLAKIKRIAEIYKTKVPDTPHILFEALEAQKQRLEIIKKNLGDYVSPEALI
ncbi:phosphoenolpyruvate carboxykinase [candidate division WOR-1 bacterium DG_54_3]|uniref:Phosphoenolpyruvate carboxykinase [GTP] n=1 Tax=candidate division WOR-1 bacterium DG_54_3 TaxID=1703775 RepID=A0A0S7XP98_UNCSA|nr:MAG: phosphoenolpyruvate carboxykinase [candidate division WOR-1 bacterium DG_54_3]